MINDIKIESVIFFDIETATHDGRFSDLKEELANSWEDKHIKNYSDLEFLETSYEQKASLHAEFGRVCCISIAMIVDGAIVTRSFYGDDEPKLLKEFILFLAERFYQKRTYLCGHNIKNFDVPYIAKRLIINGINVPRELDMAFKKPWDLDHLIDTMEFWRMGNFRGNESLSTLCSVFGVPTPKDDISGKDVSKNYHNGNIERIKQYCEKDSIATYRVFCKLRCESFL